MGSNGEISKMELTQILTAICGIKNGDFSVRLPREWDGLAGKIADAFNEVVEINQTVCKEMARIAHIIGKEGGISQRFSMNTVSGYWQELTNSINSLIEDLLWPTTEMTRVVEAVAKGDLSQTMDEEVHGRPLLGEFLQASKTLNTMVNRLSTFASEVTRVAYEVGTEGKLGGQAEVKGVSGTWKDLTDSVNSMARNLTNQVRNIAEVTTAVAQGSLSKKITAEARGEILEMKNTINTMIDQLNSFASEVTRVAYEVGTEGKLGGQAEVKGVSGTWKDLTDSVNSMASNLTNQVRNIAEVTKAVAQGSLSKKITAEARGEILEMKNTINTMIDQLNSFASEVTRVAREVGTEGKLGGQADVKGVSGTWKDLTDSVNSMASNLTNQVRNIADVTKAVALGSLSKKITAEARGEILEMKNTINTMIDQLNSFASEVTRVAREVGTDGKLGGQADVKGVSGTWKDLTDSVNSMAKNLTNQVRNIAEVTKAVALGTLATKITAEARGEILEMKNTINTMIDQLNSFASEVTRVAREVGTDGKLGVQAEVKGMSGTWKDLTDNVNFMANNLTNQVRNIAEVTTAVANGDLSKKITAETRGEIQELKDTINMMVEQLRSFASEVTRVAREVGTEGKLGGQADVKGVSGTWKDLTDSVNSMASNLTNQVRDIAKVTIAVANGDLSKKIGVDVRGEFLQLKETINTMVDQLRSFASEVTRVAQEVGTEGRLGGQAFVSGVAGTWKDLTDSVNFMAGNLTNQVRNIAKVTTAVASGDLSKKITVEVKGEMLELKNTINTMVDQLNSFASEVTRVAREVGTEGRLGGQAQVRGVAGTWKELTDNVNLMAANLTDQVRGIAKVVTTVATGNLKQKLAVTARGEIAALQEIINSMIDTLAIFADQVTTVAREVGVEGRLGGQANVPGASGTWKDLTDNVNRLAANLTTQVRAIAEVATAVAKGDLTRTVKVEARGEVEALKENVNQMIGNLRETTQRNAEQDWLKTNLAKFTRMLQGQKDLSTVARAILSELAPVVAVHHGIFYMISGEKDFPRLKLTATYGYKERKHIASEFKIGEGLVGQCAFEKQRILLSKVPYDYITINSGLGEGTPLNLVLIPILFEGQLKAVVELASFERFGTIQISFLEQLAESIGVVLNTIEVSSRTEGLLQQSQNLAKELQNQQEELQRTNEQLEEKARLLEEQKVEVERKNREVENARFALETKAEQLSLTSKYKSQFLANMSHELRTPLNSLLILAQQLSENPEGNLTAKQKEFATTIHGAGSDLLNLINDILDLAKIESRTTSLDITEIPFTHVRDEMEGLFRHLAENKKLTFRIELGSDLPPSIQTDRKRLLQILKNLLSNAFKFTQEGSVELNIAVAKSGWSLDCVKLVHASRTIAFTVSDTGIGIPPDKQKLIFEAFHQADGSTNRKYGGTGLGLAISRELAVLLGGELKLTSSVVGKGSVFTLFLPWETEPAGESYDPSNRSAGNSPVRTLPYTQHLQVEHYVTRDDRNVIKTGDRVALIVEDDVHFVDLVLESARERNFKGIVARNGQTALAMASQFKPSVVILDIHLPDIDGWAVLNCLKLDSATRHIPVYILSIEPDIIYGLQHGAIGHFTKPVNKQELLILFDKVIQFIERKTKKILIVEGDVAQRENIAELIGNGDTHIITVDTSSKALKVMQSEHLDCAVLNLTLPDTDLFQIIEELKKDTSISLLPLIINSTRELMPEEESRLRHLTETMVIKCVHSPERLLDECTLFLHRAIVKIPQHKQKMIEKIYSGDVSLAGKTVLLVDDDIRNLFSLSTVLERHQMKVITAENGKSALEMVRTYPEIHIILMDIMMPEMDGYEAIGLIRKTPGFEQLPIIALTAKAMKGDREKCIEAGASDYLAKPVVPEQLLSLLRVWLFE